MIMLRPRRTWTGVLALLALIATGCASADGGDAPSPEVVAGSSPESEDPPPDGEKLSSEEALRADAAQVAEDMGWDEDEALARLQHQEGGDDLIGELRTEYPDTYAGTWLERDVDGRQHVRFVDGVPEGAREAAERRGLSVEFHGDGKYTPAEQQELLSRVMDEVSDLGWGSVVGAYSVSEQRLEVTLERPDDDRTDEELRAELPDELRSPNATVRFSDEPVAGSAAGGS